jgi:hypothetical protein
VSKEDVMTRGYRVLRLSLTALPLLLCLGLLASSTPVNAQSKTFCIHGESDGGPDETGGWSWAIKLNGNPVCSALRMPAIPPSGDEPTDAQAFRDAFVEAITADPDCNNIVAAIPHPDPRCFTLLFSGDLQFFVGPYDTDATQHCEVTNNPGGCPFNPIIMEEPPTPTEASTWGMIKMLYR